MAVTFTDLQTKYFSLFTASERVPPLDSLIGWGGVDSSSETFSEMHINSFVAWNSSLVIFFRAVYFNFSCQSHQTR